MHLFTRNVNTAFKTLIEEFRANGEYAGSPPIVKQTSRNGSVLRIDEPVTVTYSHPRERCLFNAARDVNPFSLLYESLYMLAGRNDVAPLAHYTKKFADFSDDGVTLNGAYGYRWRNLRVDQLDILVAHLKADPNSRRAVLQMWNVEDDLLKIGFTQQVPADEVDEKIFGEGHWASYVSSLASKDTCCNLSVMFSLRSDPADEGKSASERTVYHRKLDITVTNRSNDMIWGMLGANYVTFSVLQEYVAARLGVQVGKYHHFTNNLHVYDWNWKPEEWLADPIIDLYGHGVTTLSNHKVDFAKTPPITEIFPLVRDPGVFEKELQSMVGNAYGEGVVLSLSRTWEEPFFQSVAKPMFCAFAQHKLKCPELAMGFANQIAANDWRIACTAWLQRRIK